MVNKFGIMSIEDIEAQFDMNCLSGIDNDNIIDYDTDPKRPINIVQRNGTTDNIEYQYYCYIQETTPEYWDDPEILLLNEIEEHEQCRCVLL